MTTNIWRKENKNAILVFMANKTKQKLNILDVTIRDGSYLINFSYTPEQIAEIVRLLDEAGVSYIEASHGIGVGATRIGYPHGADDIEYAKAAARAAKSSKVGAIGYPKYTSLDDISRLAEYVDFFRLMCSADEPEIIKDYVKRCRKEGLECFAQLVRSSALPPKAVAKSVAKLSDYGVDVIYVVDTTGCLIPGEVTKYIEEARKLTKQRLGFHAHNTFQLAVANTLEAIDAGCDFVDASLLGVGRDAGNASLESLVIILNRMKKTHPISLKKIIIASEHVKTIFPNIPRPSWYTYYLASFRRDLYPVQLIDMIAKECNKDPFKVIDTFASMPNIVECTTDDLAKLISKLGGDPDKIFEKYQIRKVG